MALGNLNISLTTQFAQPVAITPTTIPANSVQTEAYTIKTLTPEMTLYAHCTTLPVGLLLLGGWVSANNTVTLAFWNLTGVDITPGTQIFHVISF